RYGPSVNTRRLLVEEGGFLYDSDAYNDELPYWLEVGGRPHLVVPYSLGPNDVKFVRGSWSTAQDFFAYVRDGFDVLYRAGPAQPPARPPAGARRLGPLPGLPRPLPGVGALPPGRHAAPRDRRPPPPPAPRQRRGLLLPRRGFLALGAGGVAAAGLASRASAE